MATTSQATTTDRAILGQVWLKRSLIVSRESCSVNSRAYTSACRNTTTTLKASVNYSKWAVIFWRIISGCARDDINFFPAIVSRVSAKVSSFKLVEADASEHEARSRGSRSWWSFSGAGDNADVAGSIHDQLVLQRTTRACGAMKNWMELFGDVASQFVVNGRGSREARKSRTLTQA